MMEHKCCDRARRFLKYDEEQNCWHVLFVRVGARYGSFQAEVEFCPWCGARLSRIAGDIGEKPKRIMSGEYSRDMWNAISSAETVEDLQDALYFVCCRLQELEGRLAIVVPDYINE